MTETTDLPGNPARAWIAALRPSQWAKNVLLAVPLVAAHRALDAAALGKLALMFACFSACASAVYLYNDVADAAADRLHPVKRRRPVAAGLIAPGAALAGAAVLLGLAFALAALLLPLRFVTVMAAYTVIAGSYTVLLKRVVGLDVMTLALLYTLRLVAGGLAFEVPLSFWLLAFSGFLFLSLALVKRYSELGVQGGLDRDHLPGRDYGIGDQALLGSAGVSAGYLSVLVLALYVHADTVSTLYRRPELLGLICPLLLFWITRVWLLAHRGRLPDDPVAFALRDVSSWVVALATLAVFWVAR